MDMQVFSKYRFTWVALLFSGLLVTQASGGNETFITKLILTTPICSNSVNRDCPTFLYFLVIFFTITLGIILDSREKITTLTDEIEEAKYGITREEIENQKEIELKIFDGFAVSNKFQGLKSPEFDVDMKFGIEIYNPFLQDFVNVQIELNELHHVILDANGDISQKIIRSPEQDNPYFENWNREINLVRKENGHEVVLFGRKEGTSIEFVLGKNKKPIRYKNDGYFFPAMNTDIAKTYFEIFFSIGGDAGIKRISDNYILTVDYITTKIYRADTMERKLHSTIANVRPMKLEKRGN